MRELWLQPCADGELGAALYSNAAFAALKCMSPRIPDGHVGIAAVVRLRPRHNLLKVLSSSVHCAFPAPCILHTLAYCKSMTLVCSAQKLPDTIPRKKVCLTYQPALKPTPAGRAHMQSALPAAL